MQFNWVIAVENTEIVAAPNSRNKKVIFKNCAPSTEYISEINKKEIDHAKNIGIVMLMYNLIEYGDNYSKTFGSLWQYYRNDQLFVEKMKLANNLFVENLKNKFISFS